MSVTEKRSETEVILFHLTSVIGLCQTPREHWTPEDTLALRRAQSFVQKIRGELSESRNSKENSTVA